jgi:uncharacterized Fe-S cluster-containing radical SAM superfamily protein
MITISSTLTGPYGDSFTLSSGLSPDGFSSQLKEIREFITSLLAASAAIREIKEENKRKRQEWSEKSSQNTVESITGMSESEPLAVAGVV